MKRILLFASLALLSLASVAGAQVRQTALYIDKGDGTLTTLQSNGAGTITLPAITGTATIQGNTFNGASQLVQLNGSTQYPAIDGSLITLLNGSAVASGLVPLQWGGTHTDLHLTGGASFVLRQNSAGADITVSQLAQADISGLTTLSSPTFAGLTLSSPLTVANGGTGLATLTAHSIQVGNTTGNVTQLAVGSTGTILTGVSTSDPSFSATPTLGVAGTTAGTLALSGLTSGTVTLQSAAAAGGHAVTFPDAGADASAVLSTYATTGGQTIANTTDNAGINKALTVSLSNSGVTNEHVGLQFNVIGGSSSYDVLGTSIWSITPNGNGTFGQLTASSAPGAGIGALSVTNTSGSAAPAVGIKITANTANASNANDGITFNVANAGAGGTANDIVGSGTTWKVTSAGAITSTSLDAGSGTITTSGALQTTSTGNITASGTGNINATGGALQTAGTTRVDNSGNLSNIGTITASAAPATTVAVLDVTNTSALASDIGAKLTVSGAGTVNSGLTFAVSGAGTNNDIVGTTNSWSISSTGAASVGSLSSSNDIITTSGNFKTGSTTRISSTGAGTLASLNNSSGGITNAGAISGAATIAASAAPPTGFAVLDVTSTSAQLSDIGAKLTVSGAGTVNTGLTFAVSGAGTNNDILGSSSTWKVTAAGAGTLASLDAGSGTITTSGTIQTTSSGNINAAGNLQTGGTTRISSAGAGTFASVDAGSGLIQTTGNVQADHAVATTSRGTSTPDVGGYYKDNAIAGWGVFTSTGGTTFKFGFASCTKNATGNYTVVLQNSLSAYAVTATVSGSGSNAWVTATRTNGTDIEVDTYDGLTGNAADEDFNIIVVGRP
ncbi:MAG: hypothetical protein Q8902_02670 [Bacteroidota bacterium]|nr:hypothetical protein [Bacteroidota bacterium]